MDFLYAFSCITIDTGGVFQDLGIGNRTFFAKIDGETEYNEGGNIIPQTAR